MNNDNESPQEQTGSSELGPCRRDGWTPFARRLFLSVLAETGRVTWACECAGLTKQAAYGLRNRDPVFAAGWDAACHLARNPLADEVMEWSVTGVTDTITRNGEVVAERRRFDSRLSMAVLTRLDKRCDEARKRRAQYLHLVRNWDAWLKLVGEGDDQGARAVLTTGSLPPAQNSQLGQLSLVSNPATPPLQEPPGDCWQDGDGVWWTDFPPPPEFDGLQEGRWGDWRYKRECTEDEADLLDALDDVQRSESLAEAEADRESYFAELRQELHELQGTQSGDQASEDLLTESHGDPLLSRVGRHPELDPRSVFTSQGEEKGQDANPRPNPG